MLETVTFLLAIAGYAGLTATVVLAASGLFPRSLWRLSAIAIAAHVALVWAVRYEWRVGQATRNGYAGFVIFHGALALIVASVFLRERTARVLTRLAFGVVSLGALGAVFRYEEVALYRAPVILLAVVGTGALARAWWRGRPA